MKVLTVDDYIRLPTYVRKINIYQNVNTDPKLRNKVTLYFQEIYIDYLKNKSSNKKAKSFLSEIKGKKGYNIVYNLIKLYVKKNKENWYDLKKNKRLVLNFFNQYLSNM